MSPWWWLVAIGEVVVILWVTWFLMHPDMRRERMAFFTWRPRPRVGGRRPSQARAERVEAGKPHRVPRGIRVRSNGVQVVCGDAGPVIQVAGNGSVQVVRAGEDSTVIQSGGDIVLTRGATRRSTGATPAVSPTPYFLCAVCRKAYAVSRKGLIPPDGICRHCRA